MCVAIGVGYTNLKENFIAILTGLFGEHSGNRRANYMGQHRKSKKQKRARKPPPKDMTIHPEDVKIRKRIAPGVRIIKSDKDKERKHKKNFLEELEE